MDVTIGKHWMKDPPSVWKFSWRWLSKRLNCTLDGIVGVNGCGGCCVHLDSWPPSSDPEGNGVCKWLGDEGCSLSPSQRPIVCLLFPLALNSTGTVIMPYYMIRSGSPCKPNYKSGPMLVDAFKEQLTAIIGQAAYEQVRQGAINKKDVSVQIPEEILCSIRSDWERATVNMPPESRDGEQPSIIRTLPPLLNWRIRRNVSEKPLDKQDKTKVPLISVEELLETT